MSEAEYEYKYCSTQIYRNDSEAAKNVNAIANFTANYLPKGQWQIGVSSLAIYSQDLPLIIYPVSNANFHVGLQFKATKETYWEQIDLISDDFQNPQYIYNRTTWAQMINNALGIAASNLNSDHPGTIPAGGVPQLVWNAETQLFELYMLDSLYNENHASTIRLTFNENVRSYTFFSFCNESYPFTAGIQHDITTPSINPNNAVLYAVKAISTANDVYALDATTLSFVQDASAATPYIKITQQATSDGSMSDVVGVRVFSNQMQIDPETASSQANSASASGTSQQLNQPQIVIDLYKDPSAPSDNSGKLTYVPPLERWHNLNAYNGLNITDINVAALLQDGGTIPLPLPARKNAIIKYAFRRKTASVPVVAPYNTHLSMGRN